MCWFPYVCHYPAKNKKQKDEHEVALKKEQDEVAKLKAELVEPREKHREEFKAFSEEQICQEAEAKTLRELATKAEVDANSAKEEFQKLQDKIRVWHAEFAKIQSFMIGKFHF